jgi:hypothetical protein
MEGEILDEDIARNSAPSYHDAARHSLTIKQAAELFAQLGVPRSKRSVQRFCEQGHLDCVRIKGARGGQFFINRESVARYAEELRQIEAVATIGVEARHDAPERAIARSSAPERVTAMEPVTEAATRREPEELQPAEVKLLKDENLNLRIDNRAKEIAIAELNRRLTEDRDKFLGAMQDMSYKLGAAETRLAQLEAPKESDEARQTATDPGTAQIEAIIVQTPVEPPPAPQPEPEPRSFLGRLFR